MPKIKVKKFNYKEMEGKRGIFYKIGILTEDKEGNDVWINGLADGVPQWNVGQEIELEITNHPEYGFQFPFMNVPKQSSISKKEFEELKKRVEWLETAIKVGKTPVEQLAEEFGGVAVPNDEVKLEDIPF